MTRYAGADPVFPVPRSWRRHRLLRLLWWVVVPHMRKDGLISPSMRSLTRRDRRTLWQVSLPLVLLQAGFAVKESPPLRSPSDDPLIFWLTLIGFACCVGLLPLAFAFLMAAGREAGARFTAAWRGEEYTAADRR